MLLSAALLSFTLVGLSSAAAVEPRKNNKVLYARADVKSPDGAIEATVEFTGYLDGRGTKVEVKAIKGFTPADAPYPYHLHTNYLDSAGSCATALGHLDPLHYTDSVVCDPVQPRNCQEGDLSGKHGKLPGWASGASPKPHKYTDDYVRFFPDDHSILGRSIVFHASDKRRIACGNITSLLDGTAYKQNGKWTPTYKLSSYTKTYPAAYPNPAQTGVTPFVKGKGPLISVLKTMTFPLANTAIPIYKALYIKTYEKNFKKWVNGVKTDVKLPWEKKVNPFHVSFL